MATKARNQRWRTITTILIGLLAVLSLMLANNMHDGLLQHVELIASDWMVYGHTPPPPTGIVVIAAIDDKSIARFGRWPWPRSVHARLVDALRGEGVAVIGFDDLLTERDPADVERTALADSLRAAGIRDPAIF